MLRKDREMDENFGLMVIDKSQYAVLSTVKEDGSPYCVPVSPVRVGKSLYIHGSINGLKNKCMRLNGRVCLSFVGDVNLVPEKFTTEYESAVVTGVAREITDDGEKTEALKQICLKYAPSNMENFEAAVSKSLFRTAIWKIDITEITAKRKKYDKYGKEMTFGRME